MVFMGSDQSAKILPGTLLNSPFRHERAAGFDVIGQLDAYAGLVRRL
jgi:hypothetical protein